MPELVEPLRRSLANPAPGLRTAQTIRGKIGLWEKDVNNGSLLP